ALISPAKLYVAHVGDSRAALISKTDAIYLTEDHKPNLPKEKKRIENAGYVVRDKRVDGKLAVSRAIGDSDFKQHIGSSPEELAVIAIPDISEHGRSPDWEYLVLACDGLWDVLEPKGVAAWLRENRPKHPDLAALAHALAEHAVKVRLLSFLQFSLVQ